MKRREEWIDCARVCAIFCVVLCHAVESYYGAVLQGGCRVSGGLWFVENTLFTIGRLGVPLFLAITGTLLLGREWKAGEFYRRSLFPLVVTTEIWIVLNYVFVCIFQETEFAWRDLVCEMFFLRTLELSHMWYMPMILGIYLVIPFLSAVVRNTKEIKSFCIPYFVGCFAFLAIPTWNVFLAEDIFGGEILKFKIETGFLGGVYGLYLFGGYFIARKKVLEKIKRARLLLAGGLAFSLNTAGQYYLYSHEFNQSTKLLWYSSVCIFVMGMVFFELIRRGMGISKEWAQHAAKKVAKCSFGIYLLHKPLLVLMMKYFSMTEWNVLAGMGALLVGGMAGSLVLLLPFCGKRIGKLIFYMKE